MIHNNRGVYLSWRKYETKLIHITIFYFRKCEYIMNVCIISNSDSDMKNIFKYNIQK